ncbi:hypothetical protein Cgig2_016793 [Carnegiea gigantea]|uniref:Uncharacterized protein n=1 Tax=Carnegiea gigantea TaxID=171969 RepID=A0A9Q1JLK0_9CARY|nr:hypothetical protein Cgig2_016793 [Carnegiea gigantea]
MVKPSCCDMKKGPWKGEEDVKILGYISKNGTGNWTSAPRKAGLKRCGKSCRLRWTNYLRPDLKHESFTPEEEELIIKLHAAIGSRWTIIAQQLPGRSDNDIKNHWNTKLKKKLTEMGIDPVTHKPFSQILADYGNIGAISRATTAPKHTAGTIRRDFKKRTFTPLTPPKTQPRSSTFSSPALNNYTNYPSHSLDLLSQLQAMTLVTEGSSVRNYGLFSQMPLANSSSTSACSSSYNAGPMAKSPESFSWHDFLLDPAPNQPQDEEDNSSSFSSKQQFGTPPMGKKRNNNDGEITNGYEVQHGSSSSTSSDGSLFLEAMLDQENDMFLNFPGLMEEPLY